MFFPRTYSISATYTGGNQRGKTSINFFFLNDAESTVGTASEVEYYDNMVASLAIAAEPTQFRKATIVLSEAATKIKVLVDSTWATDAGGAGAGGFTSQSTTIGPFYYVIAR